MVDESRRLSDEKEEMPSDEPEVEENSQTEGANEDGM